MRQCATCASSKVLKISRLQFEETRALADRDPVFKAKGAHLANQSGAVADHLVADAMKRLKINLVRALQFDKPHRGTGYRLGNRRCVAIMRTALLRIFQRCGPSPA